ncbi:hypothetical protein C1Y63_08285 [Corynebacterium sp. 13CS0277]|uniref:helicase-associated domain-containing protein n=1 Tax=Corynebacterium sp. 13CS0277 TaxID=2071994 RepID=UPI000D02C706|nr:helicase-associated domain-containing protein [Corynebacterium sp. 13CS0277]PRQ10987.1 hypothetical protein C1Y63_08285 [Corynebacterium sp. 13CS0277]
MTDFSHEQLAEYLTEHLRSMDEHDLARMLAQRADVLRPRPASLEMLATRLTVGYVPRAAYDNVSATALLVLAALEELLLVRTPHAPVTAVEAHALIRERFSAATGPVDPVVDRLPTEDEVTEAVEELAGQGLVFDLGPRGLMTATPQPRLPRLWNLLPDPGCAATAAAAAALVEELPETCQRVVTRLAEGPGVGTSLDAAADADPELPIPRLIAAGILTSDGVRTVELVPAAFRQALHPRLAPIPLAPLPAVPLAAQAEADARAAGAAAEATRLALDLVRHLDRSPLRLLKGDVIGVRPAAALAKQLGITVPQLGLLVAVLEAAGMLAAGEPEPHPEGADLPASRVQVPDYLAPTPQATEEFLSLSLAEAWLTLVGAWLSTPYQASAYVASEHGPALRLRDIPDHAEEFIDTKRQFLAAVATVPAGHGYEDMGLALRHARPRRALLTGGGQDPARGEAVEDFLSDATFLGLLTGGQPVSLCRTIAELLPEHPDFGAPQLLGSAEAVAAAQELFPPAATMLIPQGDMTLLAPGPLEPTVYEFISTIAELESPGVATTWRITDTSLKRAMSAGQTPETILATLERSIVGEVPQAMRYLIADIGRTHGVLRAGMASSYIRTNDEALLAEAVASPAGRAAGLRLIAPTVAVSWKPLAAVIQALQEGGYQPAAENDLGHTIQITSTTHRVERTTAPAGSSSRHAAASTWDEAAAAPRRTGPVHIPYVEDTSVFLPAAYVPRTPSPAKVRDIIATLRAADTSEEDAPQSPQDIVDLLATAARRRSTVTLSYVTREGVPQHSIVQPLHVNHGTLDAVQTSTGQVTRFAVHRLTHVRPTGDGD